MGGNGKAEQIAAHSTNLCGRDLCIDVLDVVKCKLQYEHGQSFISNMVSARDTRYCDILGQFVQTALQDPVQVQKRLWQESSPGPGKDTLNDSRVTSYNKQPTTSHGDLAVDYGFDNFDLAIENWCTNQRSLPGDTIARKPMELRKRRNSSGYILPVCPQLTLEGNVIGARDAPWTRNE